MSKLSDAVHAFVRSSLKHEFGKPKFKGAPDAEWAKMTALGTQLWLDTGDMDEAAKLWNSSFSALTTNNTLLNKEIQKGIYDSLVAGAADVVRRAQPDVDERTLRLELAFILNAWHGLRLVEQFDTRVSVELHTDLANDVEATVAYGLRYFAICPERFIVKVPLTPAGYLGARRLKLAGVPINFTLEFSARQNVIAALLTKPDYVNVFMGRINAVIADNKLGTGENAGEKATLATQRALRKFRDEGRSPTKLIGASVRSGAQIAALSGLDVFTMPPKAAAEYRAKPPAQVVARTSDDPAVPLAPGVDANVSGIAACWELSPKFMAAVDALLAKNLDVLTPDDIVNHFASAGFPDLFPRWTAAEFERATKDGKIPVVANWKDRLAKGEAAMDSLLNLAAFCSFTLDQQALDARVMSLLK